MVEIPDDAAAAEGRVDYLTPPGALGPQTVRTLQQVTPETVLDAMAGQVRAAADPARRGFLDGLRQDVFAPLAKAFTGAEGGLPEVTRAVADQQDKTLQLWDERGRGHVFSAANLRYRGSGRPEDRLLLPFTEQVGPLVGTEILPDGGLRILTAGAWQAYAKVAASGTGWPGRDWLRMWLELRRADGSLLAESWNASIAGTDQAAMVDVMPFVVSPDDVAAGGVELRVYMDSGRWRHFLGGHGMTLLSVQKFSSSSQMSTANPGDPGVDEPSESEAALMDDGGAAS